MDKLTERLNKLENKTVQREIEIKACIYKLAKDIELLRNTMIKDNQWLRNTMIAALVLIAPEKVGEIAKMLHLLQ